MTPVRPSQLRRWIILLAGAALALRLLTVPTLTTLADAVLTIEPTTWNVIGLDSNDVNAGPNTFPVGARVCNTGDADATNLVASFVWDGLHPYLSLSGSSSLTLATLAPGECYEFVFYVTVTRSTLAYDTTALYHITVSADGLPDISTPTPRELYVEHLVSQNRNGVRAISIDGTPITFGSTITLSVSTTYTFTVEGFTATGGYEQLESFLTYNNTMFEILSISASYDVPSGATNDQVYADACGWDNDPGSATYRSCIGPDNYAGGNAGGDPIITTYVVHVMAAGTATLQNLIYDFSGSSYHYNSDFDDDFITVIAAEPTPTPTQTPTSTATGTAIATQTSTPTPDPGGTATPTPSVSGLLLPETGFAPGRRSRLPPQPESLNYRTYDDLWLEIPAQNVSIPIVGVPVTTDGWDVSWLGSEAGYLNGTAFPTWLGNSGIAGHVVLSDGQPGPFARLRDLQYGDQVIVRAWGLRHVYQVRQVAHVSPRDPFALRHEELSWLTLITCEGYLEETDSYQGRVAVRAVLVSVEADEGAAPDEPDADRWEVRPV